MMILKIMTKEEQNTVICVEDDIRIGQNVLQDNGLLYDDDDFNFNRARETLLYGAYNDNLCYIGEGLSILKATLQNIEGLETEDYDFFNGCISALQKVVDRHARK
jgi:hypothetical protein